VVVEYKNQYSKKSLKYFFFVKAWWIQKDFIFALQKEV